MERECNAKWQQRIGGLSNERKIAVKSWVCAANDWSIGWSETSAEEKEVTGIECKASSRNELLLHDSSWQ